MPEVSILIAARNEEAGIVACLSAIDRLNVPDDFVEVLVGDDHSGDRTAELVAAFIRDKPRFKLTPIDQSVGSLGGKSNVLAQLARQARGKFLFFTDADCEVPADWIKAMLLPFRDEAVGVVTGCTQIQGGGFFERLQAVDWFYGQFLIYQLSRLGIPVTAMGNNMAVRHSVYREVGGYEALPFSIVEDYQLFREIIQRGHRFAHLFHSSVLATTRPLPDWTSWLHQRKRWMTGALQLPVVFIVLFILQLLFYPFLLVLAFWSPAWALSLWGIKFLVQAYQVLGIIYRFERWDLLPAVPLFDPYLHLGYFINLIYYFLPNRIVWKGRTY